MRALLWGLVLGACSGNDEDNAPPPVVGDDDATPTADTFEVEVEARTALEARFLGFIAWNAETEEIVDFTDTDGASFRSAYVIDLFEVEGDFAASNRCRVSLSLVGLQPITVGLEPPYLWRLDVPAGRLENAQENCLEQGFDPAQFVNGGDPIATWGNYTYRMSFGGEISAENAEWIKGSFGSRDGFTLDWYLQGGWEMEGQGTISTNDDNNFINAFDMNGDNVVDFESPKTNNEFFLGTGELSSGYYVFDQRVHIDLPTSTLPLSPKKTEE